MAEIYRCSVADCKYNCNGDCEAESVEIEEVLTIAGFHPHCVTYEEKE